MVRLVEQAAEEIHLIQDEVTGLDGAIVLHSTVLGPAAGGCRVWSYADDAALLTDACRLAEGMSYKNALAGLPFGGGKAVLRQPSGAASRKSMFEAFGRAIELLQGRYVTAEDVGTTIEDMCAVASATRFVAGLPPRSGLPGGDPSPWTARGVFLAMEAAVQSRLERDLSGCTVAIQGVGNVGGALARMLHAAGARLVLADVDAAAVARIAVETDAEVTSVDAILTCKADVLAPCALGGVLNSRSVGRLQAKVVCGAANNQLLEPDDAVRLADRDILYAPDFVVNAGGIINVAAEYLQWSQEAVQERVDATSDRLRRVLALAASEQLTTHAAAEQLAREMMVSGTMAHRDAA